MVDDRRPHTGFGPEKIGDAEARYDTLLGFMSATDLTTGMEWSIDETVFEVGEPALVRLTVDGESLTLVVPPDGRMRVRL